MKRAACNNIPTESNRHGDTHVRYITPEHTCMCIYHVHIAHVVFKLL